MSYISTSNAILYCGATPKFVDVDYRTFNICPKCTEKAIDANTKAIIVVDLKGQPVDYLKFEELSKSTIYQYLRIVRSLLGLNITEKKLDHRPWFTFFDVCQ